jgi:hypothetical protein
MTGVSYGIGKTKPPQELFKKTAGCAYDADIALYAGVAKQLYTEVL